MEDSWEKLAGDAVEKEVAASARAMHKCLKTFTQRGLTACAANCEAMQADIAEFQRVVPLVVVGQVLIHSAANACLTLMLLFPEGWCPVAVQETVSTGCSTTCCRASMCQPVLPLSVHRAAVLQQSGQL